jgi:DNA topoisomerase I
MNRRWLRRNPHQAERDAVRRRHRDIPRTHRSGKNDASAKLNRSGNGVASAPDESALESAKAAGLVYVSDSDPGFTRQRAGAGFRYVDANGKAIRQSGVLQRIKALVIPPAWTDVWICPSSNGHIQATGRDDRGRKQYLYHERWREVRDQTKYDRMAAFGKCLPRIRQRTERDLRRRGLPREKILAAVVRLLRTTLIRVGNEEYARQNNSFGLTTMRDHHACVKGSKIQFQFRGKGGIKHAIDLEDRRLAKVVKGCQDLPGQELFQYIDEAGEQRSVESADVNAYLREITGEDFTAKDFRTWAGTVLAACALREFKAFDSATQAKRNVVRAIESVAQRLGNTKAICRKCYVHPAVIDAYLDGSLRQSLRRRLERELKGNLAKISPEEAAVLAFLQKNLKK